MSNTDRDFEAYLKEIVRRDQEGISANALSLGAVRAALNTKKSKARQRDHLETIWSFEKQCADLSTLLTWRLGAGRGQQIANKLMSEFGSLPAVLSASRYRLLNVSGVGYKIVETLWTIREVAERMAFAPLEEERPVLSSWNDLLSYLRIKTAFSEVEHFHILFLDKKNRLIGDEAQQRGTIDHAPVYPREVVRRCLELGAASIIICHNHPSGDPSPSMADVKLTKELFEVTKLLGITLHDHVIVGRSGHASMRALRLIG